jgi:acetylglutamate kinase
MQSSRAPIGTNSNRIASKSRSKQVKLKSEVRVTHDNQLKSIENVLVEKSKQITTKIRMNTERKILCEPLKRLRFP